MYGEDNWTKKSVNDACTFKKYKRHIDHWTMQLLTGHLRVYRRTIIKEVHSRYWDCDTEVDDAEHALFHCPRWVLDRTELESYVGTTLTGGNVIEEVIKKEDNWNKFQALCRRIMKARQKQEMDV